MEVENINFRCLGSRSGLSFPFKLFVASTQSINAYSFQQTLMIFKEKIAFNSGHTITPSEYPVVMLSQALQTEGSNLWFFVGFETNLQKDETFPATWTPSQFKLISFKDHQSLLGSIKVLSWSGFVLWITCWVWKTFDITPSLKSPFLSVSQSLIVSE